MFVCTAANCEVIVDDNPVNPVPIDAMDVLTDSMLACSV